MPSYLISGANRGIGFGLVKSLLESSPDNIVFAGTRDVAKSTDLADLAAKHEGKLYTVKLSANSVEDAKAAAKVVEEKVGSLDVIIANAGISNHYGTIATAPLEAFTNHYNVNTLGPVIMYQAFHDVWVKSPSPKFIAISTAASSIGEPFPLLMVPYLSSKTSLNFIVSRIVAEDADHGVVAIVISPGWVQTDMGNAGASAAGMEQAPVTLQDSVEGILKVTADAKKETHNGIFWDYSGATIKW